MMNIDEQLAWVSRGVEEIIPQEDLRTKLERSQATGKPLRIKYGIDPTGSDVHIGHLVPIRIMRRFQDLGHTGVIIIGDFTARIGDPTGRDDSRPPLTPEQVDVNARQYMEQLYTVLDESRTEARRQTEWFGQMGMDDVLRLLGKFTLAQFLAHDTFRKRYEEGLSLGMHELMYPILQAYDSVAIEADVELGATEQKFNILKGRDMQRSFGQPEQVAMLLPILIGTDGVQKMSKSLNNYIAVFDSPEEKYGKTMSIPDSSIVNYFQYATELPEDEIREIEKRLETENPMMLKRRLAREIVTIYHGTEAADFAEKEFNRVFSQGHVPTEMPEFVVDHKMWIVKIITEAGLCKSSGEARRMIKQGAVRLDEDRVSDSELEIDLNCVKVLRVGKRRFIKLVPTAPGESGDGDGQPVE